MAGLTTTESQAMLDARFPTTGGTDYIAYSANGTTESSAMARTPVGATGWAAATAADPSVKANSAALTSAGASSGVTLSHWAIFSASTGGTQRTDWTVFGTTGSPVTKTLAAADTVSWAIGQLKVTLT